MSAARATSVRPSVLVVDDDQDTLDSLHEALGDEFDVVTTRNSLHARELARRSWFDVMLVDVALPGVDGLEVIRGIRDADGAPEVIVLSGVDDTRVVVAALQYGAADYVIKPFKVAELRRRIVRACERRDRISSAPVESSPGWGPAGAFLLAGADVGSLAAVSIALGGRAGTRLASSPQAALALFAELTPELVLLDTTLPTAGWRSVLRTLGASARRCPILVRAPAQAAGDIGPLPAGRDVTVIRARDLGELLDRLGEWPGKAAARRMRLPRYRPPVLRAIECMAGRYAGPLRTGDIARAAGLSVRHCGHLFRADTGSSVMAYLARLRAEVAKCLLAADDVTLSQVARAAGFSDPSHMSRVFLRTVGQRPGRFRRRR